LIPVWIGAGLAAITAGWVVWNLSLDVLWQPTDRRTVRRMLFLAGVREGESVVDLGCGDGRFVVLAARQFGAQSWGVEIDPFRVLLGRLWVRLARVGDRARIVRGDMYRADVSDADVVVLFLSPTANLKLQERLKQEMKPGSRIVSYYHPIWGWTPEEVGEGIHGDPLYLYRIGGGDGDAHPRGAAPRDRRWLP
jgi:SAM-dependent methyltransferase